MHFLELLQVADECSAFADRYTYGTVVYPTPATLFIISGRLVIFPKSCTCAHDHRVACDGYVDGLFSFLRETVYIRSS